MPLDILEVTVTCGILTMRCSPSVCLSVYVMICYRRIKTKIYMKRGQFLSVCCEIRHRSFTLQLAWTVQ